MTRASIWDIRDLRGITAPLSPRNKSAPNAPIGSPRACRSTHATSGTANGTRRLSAIGRLALRERPQGQNSAALYAQMTQLGRGAPPADVGTRLLWPGRFAEPSAADRPPPVPGGKLEPRGEASGGSRPGSARGQARSASAPRAPAQNTAGRSGSAPRGCPPHQGHQGGPVRGSSAADSHKDGEAARLLADRAATARALLMGAPLPPVSPGQGHGGHVTSALSEDLGVHVPVQPAQESFVGSVESALGDRLHRAPATPRDLDFRTEEYLRKAVADEMVLYEQPTEESGPSRPPGLGSVQPNGRAQVLEHWLRPSEAQPQSQAPALPLGRRTLESTQARPSLLKSSVPPSQGSAGAEGSSGGELEWGQVSDAAKQALRQWVRGSVGGRHCMLVLEHGTGGDALTSNDEPSTTDLRGGAALNVLSGLHADVGLMGGQEGGWLFETVFSKPPMQVLEEALQSALTEIADPRLERASDLTAEQANLALRRKSMKVQFDSLKSSPAVSSQAGSQTPANEHTRMQVWLELIRLHTEGWLRDGPPPPGAASAPLAQAKDKAAKGDKSAAAAVGSWQDAAVLLELGKGEPELEAESQQMSLDALRSQNRAIEEYVMRLVRQRDELKHIAKLAEERDSYYILGLDGPHVTEDEIKKAYRKLSRKEHPDKAGTQNTRRFQQIQHAYTHVLKQRKEGAGGGGLGAGPEGSEGSEAQGAAAVGPSVSKATSYSSMARDAADQIAVCAHRTMRGAEECVDLNTLPKQRALRVLRDLTRQTTVQLRDAARQLRLLGEAVTGVAESVEEAMTEHREYASQTVAGVGLRDRAVILEDAGRSSVSSAELLEKICDATEATLKKVERASPDAPGGGEAPKPRARGEDAANLVRLGTRLLSESLSRNAAVARRSAEEAIGTALKALELTRGLAALDIEARKERERQEKKRQGFGDDDEPMPAGDAEERASRPKGDGETGEEGDKQGDEADPERTPRDRPGTGGSLTTPRDQLKCAAKRVKERHVALRVKNLRFLSSLNEEALRTQVRLRGMLERSEGALLPEVSVDQKRRLFDLVAQLLDFALAESTRLAANPSMPPARILDRALCFALALEHGREVAMPVDSRTQALKLAALVDTDLLCQVVDGPFRRRLFAVGAKRRAATDAGSGYTGHAYGRARSNTSLGGGGGGTAAAAKAWEDAAHAYCARIARGIRHSLAPPPEGEESQGSGNDAASR
uniref:J domain-containing protein n=1 Tax=Alexandrium monilatum TaxID=311494 RepID=A0A7S4UK60_9DINO|mmetsp:Transcript_50329/g.150376  ORF Transcript_50329/g.150376 Transcript_50329/m.150376 type:complete len:1215 (+) Transcript_50329:86-3730(+)